MVDEAVRRATKHKEDPSKYLETVHLFALPAATYDVRA
jgi:hypothetical protein